MRIQKNAGITEEECKQEELHREEIQKRIQNAEEEYRQGILILTNGASEVISMKQRIQTLDIEIVNTNRRGKV